jgi:hypothetical protein
VTVDLYTKNGRKIEVSVAEQVFHCKMLRQYGGFSAKEDVAPFFSFL